MEIKPIWVSYIFKDNCMVFNDAVWNYIVYGADTTECGMTNWKLNGFKPPLEMLHVSIPTEWLVSGNFLSDCNSMTLSNCWYLQGKLKAQTCNQFIKA